MGLLIFRLWPVLIPLFIYALWLITQRASAKKKGTPPPRFRDGPWYWAVLSSLMMAICCFVFIWASTGGVKGHYSAPHMQNGQIAPAQIKP